MKGSVLHVVRICTRGGIVVAVALAVLATPSRAQDSTLASTAQPTSTVDAGGYRMHTVRAGETLWDIAHTYLGDGDLWPEIIRVNRQAVRDPHWVFPNEVLRIPPRPAGAAHDSGTTVAVAAPPATEPAPVSAAPTGATSMVASQPTATDARPPASDPADAPAASATDDGSSASQGTTLFNRPPTTSAMFATTRAGLLSTHRHEGVRPGEHNSAPYLDRDGGPRHAGSVVGVADESSVISAAEVEHYALDQELYITMPQGSRPEVGQRFYTYALGESFGDRGQVVLPTGIVTVIAPGTGSLATVARITQLFGEVQISQGVLPLDQVTLPTSQATAVSTGGVQTKVLWVEHNQVLPTLGHYVLLDASTKTGVHIGDQVTLFRPRVLVPGTSIMLPESSIAIAQVVRVTPFASTAIIMAQEQPAIDAGVAARVTARAP